MADVITLQIGQCGNQIGWEFWEKALNEHQKYHQTAMYDTSYKSFFEIIGKGSIEDTKNIRAKAILIDSELNVTNQLQRSKIGKIFGDNIVSEDITGAGNNWAVGFTERGPELAEKILEKVRKMAERCEKLRSFFMLYSLGGGTGSGSGSYILSQLADHYPKQWRMATVVMPSDNSDVIIAPYNCAMATSKLCEYADCVFPVENSALMNFVHDKEDSKRAFKQMNAVVANFLLDLTAGSRFPGQINVDLSEIKTNMIPYKNHKFLISGISPINPQNAPRSNTGYFTESITTKSALCTVNHSKGTYFASSVFVRGSITISQIRSNIDKMKQNMRFPIWNSNPWKIGMCSIPPLYSNFSVLFLTNNTSTGTIFKAIRSDFDQLFKRRAYVQMYTDHGIEVEDMLAAQDTLGFFESEYLDLDTTQPSEPRPKIVV